VRPTDKLRSELYDPLGHWDWVSSVVSTHPTRRYFSNSVNVLFRRTLA
jgi:hypothetical protein